MRPAGFTLAVLMTAGSVGFAQQPGIPGQPPGAGQPGGLPPAAKPADPKLDAHLDGWERKMTGVINLRTEVALTRTDAAFKKATNFTGSVLCMKPNFAVLRLDNTGDPKKQDYEAYVCNGKAVYMYSGLSKTVTEVELPKAGAGVDNLMLDFLAGMKAKDVKERFDIDLFKEDPNYIYLDIKPRLGKDQKEFVHLRLALYGPGAATANVAYLPAQVYMRKPNGDEETWKFNNPQVGLPGVEAKHFQYSEVPGFKLLRAPQLGAAPPAAPGGVAPAGAVRPGKP